MVRTAVFAIFLSMGGPPAVGVVCGLWCDPDGGTGAQHVDCEGARPDSGGTRLTAAHVCDHLTVVTPFVLQASPGKATARGITPHVLPVFSFSSARPSELTNTRRPPGGGRTDRQPRINVLRI